MIHLVGLPHTEFDRDRFAACAFTAKSVNLSRMLTSIGRDCTVYWGGDEDTCAEDVPFVSVMSGAEQRRYWPDYDGTQLPPLTWDTADEHWRAFNGRCIEAIGDTIRPGDYVAVVGGAIHQPVVDAFGHMVTCIEPGAGYEGLATGTFVCFESYAWMHHRYGWRNWGDGRNFDAVIPNAVDEDLFTVAEPRDPPYALFIGRMVTRKGPHVAVEIAERAGIELFMAGAGLELHDGRFRTGEGQEVAIDPDHYLGHLNVDQRRVMLSRAAVFVCPTIYVEPWGGVHAEALMSGVPVVAPDYGVFTETLPFHSRYRCLADAARAVERALDSNGRMERALRRDAAIERFGFERCRRMYAAWLDRLDSLRDGRNGWYAP